MHLKQLYITFMYCYDEKFTHISYNFKAKFSFKLRNEFEILRAKIKETMLLFLNISPIQFISCF